jgi:hypothetical protein
MDVTELGAAYDRFLESLADSGFGPPAHGEWRAELVLAHLIVTDRLIAETVAEVLNGRHPRFDSLASQNVAYLETIVATTGDWGELVREVRRGAEALVRIAGALTEEQAETPVPTYIESGGQVVVDGPTAVGDIVRGAAAAHLPLHTRQLAGLRGDR